MLLSPIAVLFPFVVGTSDFHNIINGSLSIVHHALLYVQYIIRAFSLLPSSPMIQDILRYLSSSSSKSTCHG